MTIQQRVEIPTSTLSIYCIHKIQGRKSVNILVSNYTNKHVTFNKGEYIGHLEPAITDDTTIDDPELHSANSITLQKMIAEQVQPNIFDPPHHKLKARHPI